VKANTTAAHVHAGQRLDPSVRARSLELAGALGDGRAG
jgi:hypothetical protein